MKQKILLLLTALLLSAPMWAKVGDQFTRSGVKYEVKTDYPDDPTAWVLGYESWLNGDVEILDNINGYVVTAISYSAFQDCTELKSVIIPYGVKEIKNSAFYGCSGLQSVSIPGSVELISGDAFSGCTALTSITFPEGVTMISSYAFSGCTSLVSVTIPSSLEIFANDVFHNCNSVKDVYWYAAPDNLLMLIGDNKNSFKTDGTTKFHVEASQLEKAKTFFSERLNVTFVGDLDSPVLTDGEPYTRTVEKTVSTATYEKTLDPDRIGKHQAWMVPFDYTIKEADLAKFTFYRINMIANSPSPDVETTDEVWVFLTKMKAGDKMYANMPYVYKPLEDVTDYQFTTTNTPMKAPNTDVLLKTETTTHVYSFYATYFPTSPRSVFDFYYVNDEGSISYGYGDDSGVTVSPYRWIIRQDRKGSYGGSYSHASKMYFVDGETTGIIAPKNDNGEMTTDKWYTIDGRMLQGIPTQKGVYILNGKKVVMK